MGRFHDIVGGMTVCGSARRCFVILAGIVYLALSMVTFGPALGNSAFVFGTDTYSHDYIMHMYGWDVIRSQWVIPLWCPYLFCGLPFLASFAHCPFYPSQLAYFGLPFNTAFTMQYVLAVALAAWFVAIWLRGEGLGRAASLLGGLAFMFSGHFITLVYAGHLQKMIAIAWAPLALWSTRRMLRSRGIGLPARADDTSDKVPHAGGKGGAFLTLGFSLGMQLVCSHAQIAYATVWTCLLLLGYELVFEVRSRWISRPRKSLNEASPAAVFNWLRHASEQHYLKPFAVLVPFFGAILFAVTLSAIQLLPGAEMSSVSNRAQGLSFTEATDTSYPPAELAEYLVPGAFGSSVRGSMVPYFGTWGERIVSDYLGAPLLAVALLGLALGRGRVRFYLGGIGVLSLLVGVGKHTPFYWILFKALPGFASFRSPGTFMFVADLAFVGLAAVGLETVIDLGKSSVRTSLRERPVLLGLLAAGIVTGVLAVALGVQRNLGADLAIATPAEAHSYYTYRGVITFGRELATASLVLLLVLHVCCRGEIRGRAIPPQLIAGLLGLVAVAFPMIHNRSYLIFEPLAGYLEYLHYQPAYAALEKAKEEPLRVLEERALKNDGILHAVGTPTGYHPVILGRYEELLQVLGYATERFGDLFYIRYAHTLSQQPPAGQWRAWQEMTRDVIWRRKEPAPAYAVNSARVVETASIQESAQLLRSPQLMPPGGVTVEKRILDTAQCEPGPQLSQGELVSWQPRRILIKTYAEHRAIIPIAEVYAPGWKARTDSGEIVPIIPVNIGQRGLVIPAGPRFIAMVYEPFSYRLGGFLSLLTLGALGSLGAAWIMARPFWKRWRRPGARIQPETATQVASPSAPSPAPEAGRSEQTVEPEVTTPSPTEREDDKARDQRYWDVGL